MTCMPILGHGIDLVEVSRIRRLAESHGDRFLHRVFTADERRYWKPDSKRYYEHLAGRFAAKEAILKALGTGWSGGVAWTDMEITRHPSGRPDVQLTGHCREVAERLGITRWHISISHIETHATASVIAWGDGGNASM